MAAVTSAGKRSRKRFHALSGRRRKGPAWASWPDDRLLALRFCDLGVTLESSGLEGCIEQMHAELARRGLRFRPHFWISEEWFSPDKIPGVAIPFYLTHPRLMRLERAQKLEVEGGKRESFMRILRHEVGHAIDHAYMLHRRRRWQTLFGKSSQPYPEFYIPKPYSKRYVLHLDFWYAQSHPDEDFAETFATWLKPRAVWRKRYEGWPALKKLEYVDELMEAIANTKPVVTSRACVEPLPKNRKTLREHYEAKQARYERECSDFWDQGLRQLFSDTPDHRKRESAAAFIRRNRSEVRRQVSRWTGEYQYALDLVLDEMIGRCRELKLQVTDSETQLQMDFAILLTVQTMNYLHRGGHRVAM